MLRRFGIVFLGLMGLVGFSSVAFAADDSDEATKPTVADIERYLNPDKEIYTSDVEGALQRARAKLDDGKPFEAEAILRELVKHDIDRDDELRAYKLMLLVQEAKQEVGEEAETILQRIKLQEERDRLRAAQLAEEAHIYLLDKNDAKRARELAEEALLLDPKNEKADRIRLSAGLALKDPALQFEDQARRLSKRPAYRRTMAIMSLVQHQAEARDLFARGELDRSLAEWRRALSYVELLASYMNVDAERAEIQRNIAHVQEAIDARDRQADEAMKIASEELYRARIAAMEKEENKQRAKLIDSAFDLIEEGEFAAARRVLDNLEMEEPLDPLVQEMSEALAAKRFRHGLTRINRYRQEGDWEGTLRAAEREVVPPSLFEYPDKKFWVEVVEQRAPTGYPSELLKREASPADRAIYEQMDNEYEYTFDDLPLSSVVDYLQQVTGINFVYNRQDMVEDPRLTLNVKTTLEVGLDQITDMTGTVWKVQNGLIHIGLASVIDEYELRLYSVRDLLISYADTGGRSGGDDDDDDDDDSSYRGDDDDDDDDDDTGAGSVRDRAYELIMLLQQACGAGTWRSIVALGFTGDDDDDDFFGGGGGFGGGFEGGGFEGGGFEGGFGPAGGGLAGAEGGQGTAIVRRSDPGQLVIVQTEEVHKCIEDLLRMLRAELMILVQVDLRFISVSTDFLREIGFTWRSFTPDRNMYTTAPDGTVRLKGKVGVASPTFGGFLPFLNAPLDEFYLGSSAAAGQAPLLSPFLGTGARAGTKGMNLDVGLQMGDMLLSGFFRLAIDRNKARTVSSPQITCVNGQEAFIDISTDFTYVSSYEVQDDILIPITATVSESIGMDVRPVVSADRKYVYMELDPNVSTVDVSESVTFSTFVGVAGGGDGGSGAGAVVENFITLPKQTTWELESTVGVPDRGTVIVGGLSKNTRAHDEGGLPIVSKLPLLRRIFGFESESLSEDSLFVVARPQIIILPEAAERRGIEG